MKHIKAILLLSIIISMTACTRPYKGIPDDFDMGTVENGVYTNNYFKFTFDFGDWKAQPRELVDVLQDEGADILAGDDRKLKERMKAAEEQSANLLTVFKYDLNTSLVTINPSIIIASENLKAFPHVKNESQYLAQTKAMLEQAQVDYDTDRVIYNRTIGGREFYVQEAKTVMMGVRVTQEYHVIIDKRFVIAIILTYANEEDQEEIYELLENVEFMQD